MPPLPFPAAPRGCCRHLNLSGRQAQVASQALAQRGIWQFFDGVNGLQHRPLVPRQLHSLGLRGHPTKAFTEALGKSTAVPREEALEDFLKWLITSNWCSLFDFVISQTILLHRFTKRRQGVFINTTNKAPYFISLNILHINSTTPRKQTGHRPFTERYKRLC